MVGVVVLLLVVATAAIGSIVVRRDGGDGATPAGPGASSTPASTIVVTSPSGYEMTSLVLTGDRAFTVEGGRVVARGATDGVRRWVADLRCEREPYLEPVVGGLVTPVVDVRCDSALVVLAVRDGSVVWRPRSAYDSCMPSRTEPRYVTCDHSDVERVVIDAVTDTQVGVIPADPTHNNSSWQFGSTIVVSTLAPGTTMPTPPLPETIPGQPSIVDQRRREIPETPFRVKTVYDRSGAPRWQRDVLGTIDEVGDGYYVGTVDGTLTALDGADGAVRWTVPIGAGPVHAVAAGPRLLAAASDDAVLGIDRASGSVVWKRPLTGPARVVADDESIVIEPIGTGIRGGGSFVVVDAATGAEIRRVDDVWSLSGVQVDHGRIALLTASGHGAEGRLVTMPTRA